MKDNQMLLAILAAAGVAILLFKRSETAESGKVPVTPAPPIKSTIPP